MSYLLIVSAVWAFSFVIIKGTLSGLDSGFVALARMTLSAAVFLPLLRLRGVSRPIALRLAGIGALQFGVMYVAYISAFRQLPAHMVALLTTTTPILVALFDDLLDRSLHPVFLAAAALAVAAGAVIQYPDQPLSSSLLGVALVQVSNVAFAAGQVLYKRQMALGPQLRDRDVFGLLYAGAFAVTAAASLAMTDYASLQVSGKQIGALLYLGLVASGLCFFLWNLGARRVNTGTLAILNNLKIPLGIAASLAILGERTSLPRLAAALALMGAALFICERRARLGPRAQPTLGS
ncbi:MAG: hypothetical protein A2X36_12875 [Elusimicrobia bacterium GWA2_69_24]|nr:MAG: hypothetical protein A2X36_12875 [Elusimicrobia bacterium GWA2_69_24]HBL17476.1 EamA family transporter [Elusimicrobiota bacterium]